MQRLFAFLWGIVFYAVMYLAWAGLSIHGMIGMPARITALLILVFLILIATRSIRFYSWRDVVPFSLVWMIEVIILDMLYTVPLAGWAVLTDPNVWVGYLIVLIVPLIVPRRTSA